MPEETTFSEVAEEAPVANGGVPHQCSETMTAKIAEESNRVDRMEIDTKDEEVADPEKVEGEAKVDKDESRNASKQQDDDKGDKEAKEEDASDSAPMDLERDDKEDKDDEEPKKAEVEENSVLDMGEDKSKEKNEPVENKETEEEVGRADKESERAEESKEKNEEEKVELETERDDEGTDEKSNKKKGDEQKAKKKEEDEGGEGKAEEIKEEKAEENKMEKESKKSRSMQTPGGKTKKKKELEGEVEQRTPLTDRPVRERKSVERLVAVIDKDANKEIHVEKGRGTPLKDIPNVAYKLARRKPDDTFKLLHGILFGRRGKAFQIKGNLSRFSGFVWHDNEEKQRTKVKEKFDKFTKEKLLEVCDILDIPISKATTKKEDIVVKLIDFLVAPHATTTVLLAEKESSKGQKRKRGMKRSSSKSMSGSSDRTAKSQTKSGDASKRGSKKASSDSDEDSEDEKEEEHETDNEKTENGVPEESDHEMHDQSESEEEIRSENESDEDAGKKKKQKSSTNKQSAGKAKSKKIMESEKSSPPPKATKGSSSSKHSKVDGSEASLSPRKKNESVPKKSPTPAKSNSKGKPGKKAAKGKDKAKQEKVDPSNDELRDAICEILKEVDFNTATFTDILKQLAKQFDTDLTLRKSAIKLMIRKELTRLANEADDDDEEEDADADDNAGKDEMVVNGTKVKA